MSKGLTMREQIEIKVEAYLKNGGTIKQIEHGRTGNQKLTPQSFKENSTSHYNRRFIKK